MNGVNFQTRPYTAQNLIQTYDRTAGWRIVGAAGVLRSRRVAQLTPPGSHILRVSQANNGLLTWAVRTPQRQTHIVVTNVGSSAVTVAIRAAGAPHDATAKP